MSKSEPGRKPSEAEVEILQVLWERQPCSVRAVHEEISRFKDVGYTTILKQLQRMQDKNLVTRERGEGKSFNYTATEDAGETQSKLLGRLLRTAFRGDVNELVMHALGDAQVAGEDLEALKQFINKIEAGTTTGANT